MATKEKFNFLTPLHLACGTKDELRPVFSYVFFLNGYAYATNGMLLIKQSLEDYCKVLYKERLNGHALHADAFKKILRYDTVEATEEGVKTWKQTGEKAFYSYAEEGITPLKFEQLIEQRLNSDTISSDNTAVPADWDFKVGLNPHFVGIVGRVLYSAQRHTPLKLTFGKCAYTAVLAEPIASMEYPNQMGLIMPVAITE